ncbi:MAG: hypothetical protein J5880_01680 [Bacilli bacterium]|nr:hypothetical protein [Bacilli bacterium]
MEENNQQVQEPAPKKKKKRHIGLWVTLIVIFVVVILPIGLIFAFFFDPTHTTSEELGVKTTGAAQENIAQELLVDLFDYTDDATMNNSLSISIKEQEVNQLLYDNLLSTLDENTRSVVPQAYLDVGQDNYTFLVELNAFGFFKTRVKLVTSLEMSDNPKGLRFNVDDLKIGRLGRFDDIAFNILKSNNVTDSQIAKTINDSLPLTLESHLFEDTKTHYLFYPHDNFVSDLNNMITIDSISFFKDFLIDMVSQRKFTFDFYKDKGVHGLMSLQDFHDNATYGSYDDYVIDFGAKQAINQYLPTLLKNGNVNKATVDTVSRFISYGYNQLSDSEKATIDSASYLPAVLGKSISEYTAERETKFATKGAALADVKPIENVVSEQVSDALTVARCAEILANNGGNVVDASVNEIQLHDVLKSNDLVGYGKVFYRQKDDGSYKLSYVAVDNLYVNIVNNNIYFVVGVNINGYEVSMILTSIIQSGGEGKMYFKLDGNNTYFGNYRIPLGLFNSFTSLLGDAISSSSWFSFDKTNNRFVVDFSKAINDNEQIKFLKANGLNIDIGISAVGASIADNGYLSISVNASRA